MKMPGIKFPIVDDDRFQAPRYAGAIGFDLALSGKNTSKNSSETLIIKFMVGRALPDNVFDRRAEPDLPRLSINLSQTWCASPGMTKIHRICLGVNGFKYPMS